MDREMTVTLFSDMDGCIAKWNSEASLEDTYERDYFRKCDIDENYKVMLKILEKQYGIKVVFLSAVYGDIQADAKRDWLNKNGFETNELITCPYGTCKREFIQQNLPECISDLNVLIDDFTKNLVRWEARPSFVGIKYLNGINNTHGTWNGIRITTQLPERTAEDLGDFLLCRG